MKKHSAVCDIHGCGAEFPIIPEKYRMTTIQVIFTTEQTEGKATRPYLDTARIDICGGCINKITTSGRYIQAHGAQGHNTYIIPEETTKRKK